MSIDLVTEVQQKMGFKEFTKPSPNQEHAQVNGEYHIDLSQAATIAVLAALCQYGQEEEGATQILKGTDSNLLEKIFRDKDEEAVIAVASHGTELYIGVRSMMSGIAAESVLIVRTQAKTPTELQQFMNMQRHNILAYLSPELKIGNVLDNNQLDDSTNKMEGPVSSFMHFIEDFMSSKDQTKKF